MDLIKSIKRETSFVQTICENVETSQIDAKLLFEAADKYIGNVIGALNSGKNPLETIPGSAEILAGLILLATDTNRQALNINDKKFSLVTQYTSDKEAVKKYVAQQAKDHGQSLIKNISAYVADSDRRDVLKRKLVQLQSLYSQAKQKNRKSQEFAKVSNF